MKVTDFIVCDDIRREEGKKISAMGILDREITLAAVGGPDAPAAMRFGVLIRVDLDADEIATSFQFDVRRDEESLAHITGKLDSMSKDSRRVRFVAVSDAVKISSPGLLRFEFSLRDRENRLLGVGSSEIRVTAITQVPGA